MFIINNVMDESGDRVGVSAGSGERTSHGNGRINRVT